MFFRGFLIGLVVGVWLTVLYVVFTTQGGIIRAYFDRLRKSIPASRPEPQTVATPAKTPTTTSEPRPTSAKNSVAPAAKTDPIHSEQRLNLERLSDRGTASYQRLVRLVHDEQTAQRLIQHEKRLRPNADIDELITDAVNMVLHDRR